MNLAQARLAGLKAFDANTGRAPALNRAFIDRAFRQSESRLVDLLDAYLYGWDIASLANAALPGAPSIEARAAILEAAITTDTNESKNESN